MICFFDDHAFVLVLGPLLIQVFCLSSREETCARLAKEKGLVVVPPYDHYNVIAGQVYFVK